MEQAEKNGPLSVARMVENQSMHFVIVEDDAYLRSLLTQRLSREGFLVVEAENGKAGLKAIRECAPHIVLLDIILPDMDGYEVLEEMQKDKTLSGIPVIVLSNLGQKEEVDRAKALGAKWFLIKAKYTPDEIVAYVKKVLSEAYI